MILKRYHIIPTLVLFDFTNESIFLFVLDYKLVIYFCLTNISPIDLM